MRFFYCTWALLMLAPSPAAAQQAPEPAPPTGYVVFFSGRPVGREAVTVREEPAGTLIHSQGSLGAPFNSVLRRAEIRYTLEGAPDSLDIQGSNGDAEIRMRTAFIDGTASTEGSQGGTPFSLSVPVSREAVVLPTGVFGAMTVLARRLRDASEGAQLRVFSAPTAEIGLRVGRITRDQMQSGTNILDVRRYELTLATPTGDLPLTVTSDAAGSLVRVTIPSQSIDVVRDDLASPTARTAVHSNPGDEAIIIPAAGFNLGATMTRPSAAALSATAAGGRAPAAILVGGSEAFDREGVIAGIPILTQLAGSLAEAGVLTVRYDRRGFGQSGGRAESAAIADYAEDARLVAKWLADRKDVDPKRIAIIGYGEGAWIALLAAARDKRFAAVVSLAGSATTGAELVLEQQRHAFEVQQTSPAERAAKTAMQERIHAAVLTGRGWDSIAPDVRRQADTPWFQSLLAYDPAKVIEDVRQPLLIVHGALDRQVPVEHAEKLATLARTESKSKSVELAIVRGANHLLAAAMTGEISEYATLPERQVSADVSSVMTAWLTRTLPPRVKQ